MTSVRHWDLPGIWVLELRQNFDSFKITWALNALTKPIWLGSLRRQASEQSCVDVFETRRSRAWSFLAMREGILVKSVFMIGSGDPATIISYFLPLVDWRDWRPSVLGYCLLQDISRNMCAYTLSIDAYIPWHSATLGIWISEARSLRWMSRISSIVATPIYFLRTKAKEVERSDTKFAVLSFPGW